MCHKKQYQIEKLGNGTLWHFMTYIIWHKMSWTIAIWISKEPYESDKYSCEKIFYSFLFILQCKMQKQKTTFSFVFLSRSLCKFKIKTSNLIHYLISLFIWNLYVKTSWNYGKRPETNNIWKFWNFRTPFISYQPKDQS